jgi:hypothetical protein
MALEESFELEVVGSEHQAIMEVGAAVARERWGRTRAPTHAAYHATGQELFAVHGSVARSELSMFDAGRLLGY